VSEKSITRQHAGRFRRAKNEPSAPRSLAGGCCGHKFLESRDEGELGYARLESKSEILVEGRVHQANAETERQFGYSRRELIGQSAEN